MSPFTSHAPGSNPPPESPEKSREQQIAEAEARGARQRAKKFKAQTLSQRMAQRGIVDGDLVRAKRQDGQEWVGRLTVELTDEHYELWLLESDGLGNVLE